MSEHYTRNTESVTAWCNACQRDTQHAVSDGRRGRCMEHETADGGYSKKQLRQREKRERERRQPGLFR